MISRPNVVNYVVISPLKDEKPYVETTIRAMLSQTLRPWRWIIVDDGSTDGTPTVLDLYARQYPWIQVLRLQHNTPRQPGSAVIRAFDAGYKLIEGEPFDFVVKLDCDLDLPQDYFERLVSKFAQDPTLGIASGVYLEETRGSWRPVAIPPYHAAGACKMVRATCFADIGGFVKSRGWDTVDEIRAWVRGWKTQHFEDLQFYHLKKEGSGIGLLATSAMHGEVFYLTGGSKLFLLLKVLHRAVFGSPFVLSGLAVFWGYFRSLVSRKSRLVTDEEAWHYSRLLNGRIRSGLVQLLTGSHLRNHAGGGA